MKDVLENTTYITEDGYLAILRVKRQRQWIVLHCMGAVFVAPFLGRLLYALMLLLVGAIKSFTFHVSDILFCCLLLGGIWLWHYPMAQIHEYMRRNRQKLDVNVVNQYLFFSDHVQMMTTTSAEKFDLDYHFLTWIRKNGRWIVLYFEEPHFTMLVDRTGFTKGTAKACLALLRQPN